MSFSGFYTPRGCNKKKFKDDTTPNVVPKIGEKSSEVQVPVRSETFQNEQDEVALFLNSIMPDLKKLDDEHFTMVKMHISKDIYDVYVKQK